MASEPAYWGGLRETEHDWGTLLLNRADADFQPVIAAYIERTAAASCGGVCPRLTITVSDGFAPAMTPHAVQVPSPQLVGLDGAGLLVAAFWDLLENALLAAYGRPAVRFAVPDATIAAAYRPLTALYRAANPGRSVEIVVDPRLLTAPAAALAEVDGALLSPTAELIAGGHVADVTPFVAGSDAFDEGDFYAQIWDGGWWRERLWLLPLAAQMKVIFYDRAVYAAAERPVPSLRWTWAEMEADIAAFAAEPPAGTHIKYGLLDGGSDLLYARAFTLGPACRSTCAPLAQAEIQEAAAWYAARREAGVLLDLGGADDAGRESRYLTALSSRRSVAIWVEDPQLYEYHLLLSAIGVLPFPAAADFESITPLQIRGGVISQAAADPQAVWAWLDFLSYQVPQPNLRLIPGRPSVAEETGYWQILPRPLDAAMRSAFPRGRAVTIAEQGAFSFSLLGGE